MNTLTKTRNSGRPPVNLPILFITRICILSIFIFANITRLFGQVNELEFNGPSNLSSFEEEKFKALVLKKVHLLTNYISIIADKDQENTKRQDAIDSAINFFIDKDRIVQVSSKTSKTKNIPVRTYFQRLYSIEAGKVKITFYEVARITEFTEGKDGSLHGVAQIFQLFESFDGEGRLKYTDRTIKNVRVVMRFNEKFTGQKMEKIMEVKLGDINVEETI